MLTEFHLVLVYGIFCLEGYTYQNTLPLRSKTSMEILEQCVFSVQSRSGVFFVNFEHILHIVLVFLLLTLNKQKSVGYIEFRSCRS